MAKRNGHHWHQYVFPIESAFEYSHQLNIAWHSRKTGNRNRTGIFPCNESYHSRMILTTNQKRHNFALQL